MFYLFRFLLVWCFFILPFPSEAIYNLKTKKEELPANAENKHWLLVSQGCHSCSEVLTELTKFCSGKKPSPSKIGFFATGQSIPAMQKKLKDFESGYQMFSGSPNEFYETYKLLATPSLKIKGKNKAVVGKDKILEFLKKDTHFCSA